VLSGYRIWKARPGIVGSIPGSPDEKTAFARVENYPLALQPDSWNARALRG